MLWPLEVTRASGGEPMLLITAQVLSPIPHPECCWAAAAPGNCSPLSPGAAASPCAWSEETDPRPWLAPAGKEGRELCWMVLCKDWRWILSVSESWSDKQHLQQTDFDSLDEVVHSSLGVAGHIHQSLQMLGPPDGKDHLGICNLFKLATFQGKAKCMFWQFLTHASLLSVGPRWRWR